MSLFNPWGLLALVTVPLIVILYILKQKYKEVPISSLYLWKRVLENTKAIGLDPARSTYRLGPKLEFDASNEKFVDNKAADRLLTRPYRKPFIVPKHV